MTRRDGALRQLIAGLLGAGSAAIPFLEAVVDQLTGPTGALSAYSPDERDALAREVAAMLRALEQNEAELGFLRDPLMAAAFFQNVDLLYLHEWPYADAVSAIIMQAVEDAGEYRGTH